MEGFWGLSQQWVGGSQSALLGMACCCTRMRKVWREYS